jgi:hypothetical protein
MKVKFYDDVPPTVTDEAWDAISRVVKFDHPLAIDSLEKMRKQIESEVYEEPVIWMWRREWEEFVKLCKEAGID